MWMYCWRGTRQAEHNYYWSVVKSYTLVFFFLLCRYLHYCWWAGNDPDTTWHFLVCHYAGLNEQLPYSLSTECTADEQTPLQAGLGRWGKGECHYWNDLPSPTTHSQSHSAASPALVLGSAAPVGIGGWCPVALQRDCFLLTWEMGSSSWPSAPKSQINHSDHTQVKCPLTGRDIQEEMVQRLWLQNPWEHR